MARHLHDLEAKLADPMQAQPQVEEELRALLRHACATTPFYRPWEGASLDAFPVIDKQVIKRNFADFQTGSYRSRSLVSVSTSGSYGTPFTLQLTKDKRARQRAEIIYFSRWAGYDIGMKYAYLTSVSRSSVSNFLQDRVLMVPARLDTAWLERQVRRLQEQPIQVLIGYVSAVHALAKHCLAEGIPSQSFSLKGIITMGEALMESIRAECEAAFGCPVVARYSLQELGVVAHECVGGRNYHLNTASYVVELLQPEADERVKPGQPGRIVVTDLSSHAMPLVRYDTGDLGVWQAGCDCGAEGPVLTQLGGREVEIVYDSQGRRVSPFAISVALHGLEGVLQYQFRQRGEREYLLMLVPMTEFQEEELIRERLGAILGEEARIKIEPVSSIPPLPSGKRPYIINEWEAGSREGE